MKTILPNQKTLVDIIIQDSKKIPKFIDAKKEAHKTAFLTMQSIFDTYVFLATPEVFNDLYLSTIALDVKYDLKVITDALASSINQHSNYDAQLKDNNLLVFKIQTYLSDKLDGYLKLAIELECFEAAANIKNYQKLND